MEGEGRDTAERAAATLAEEPYVHLVLLQKPTRTLAELLSTILDGEARVKLKLKLVVLPERIFANLCPSPAAHSRPPPSPTLLPTHPLSALPRPPPPAPRPRLLKHQRRLSQPL